MNETSFSNKVVIAMRQRGWHVSKVETGDTAPGFPDLSWAHAGREGTTELKVLAPGKRKLKFQRGQPAWHTARAKVGGNNTILVLDERKGRTTYRLFLGQAARRLATERMDHVMALVTTESLPEVLAAIFLLLPSEPA